MYRLLSILVPLLVTTIFSFNVDAAGAKDVTTQGKKTQDPDSGQTCRPRKHCQPEEPPTDPEDPPAEPPATTFLNAGASYQMQLQGVLNLEYTVDAYVFDLFDVSAQTIADIKNSGAKAICYFSAGTFEEWREDAIDFAPEALGEPLGDWPGEYWLDTRHESVRAVMLNRIALAKQKGCDAVDPDNVDLHTQQSGFNISYAQQLEYNMFIASSAHDAQLFVGLKNNLDQLADLHTYYDFAINESCIRWNECEMLTPFINSNKPVFHVEYLGVSGVGSSEFEQMCTHTSELGIYSLVLPRELDDAYRFSCQ
ncbi:endo alpha-1,4 polygalactosaminidase [Pseudoalteromonas pernae]|uniref:endo alpha-1,4 polygalactosaminidase n=1 Tax=Pseudoalteromonas pernae TaxID=3118054 RepID=UPI003241E2AE